MCGVIVNIDGAHVNEDAFVDRHDNHSLNCMFVCIFYYVSARYDISQTVSIQMPFYVASISKRVLFSSQFNMLLEKFEIH